MSSITRSRWWHPFWMVWSMTFFVVSVLNGEYLAAGLNYLLFVGVCFGWVVAVGYEE